MLKMCVLGSGSRGNSVLVFSETTQILVDAGLSALQLRKRMESVGRNPEATEAILLTHEHGDHIKGLDVFCRQPGLKVYTNAMTQRYLGGCLKEDKEWAVFETGQDFTIGDLEVETFPVPHDATEPMGYVIRHRGASLGILTDVGMVTNVARERLRGVGAVYLESNYDMDLLAADMKRPPGVKQRIASRHGHLSNEDAVGFAVELAEQGLEQIVLGHLSSDCNCPDKVRTCFEDKLGDDGVTVHVSDQMEPTCVVLVPETAEEIKEEAADIAVVEVGGQGEFLFS